MVLNLIDAPSTIVLAGAIAGAVGARASRAARRREQRSVWSRRPWRPSPLASRSLALRTRLARRHPAGAREGPVRAPGARRLRALELLLAHRRWRSRRVDRARPCGGRRRRCRARSRAEQVGSTSTALAGTQMYHYDGTRDSIEFLRYDLVNLAYNLPGHSQGRGSSASAADATCSRRTSSASSEIVGVELNPIFIDLHTHEPFYRDFSNLTALPNLQLYVDDARSWFASTDEKFDLIQMSMIDTWAATGAGAFTLSENGLYTLEGWRAFLDRLNDDGVFTVSRWYSPRRRERDRAHDQPGDGRAARRRRRRRAPAPVRRARAERIATLVLSKRPFTAAQLALLNAECGAARASTSCSRRTSRPSRSCSPRSSRARTSRPRPRGGGRLPRSDRADRQPAVLLQPAPLLGASPADGRCGAALGRAASAAAWSTGNLLRHRRAHARSWSSRSRP